MSNIIAGIDSQNNVRVEVEIQGLYKSTPYGAVIDTGFSGGLVLPLVTAVDIGLTKVGASTVTLADGSVQILPTFLSKVKIGGLTQDATTIIMGSEVLVGMELLTNYRFCMSPLTGEVVIDEWEAVKKLNQLTESLKRLSG
ncbi:hypothetical protein KKH23_06325 [Patescibacteria group bacterium]|nr:hypothetical protein [Patescibacteria group bacterium]